MEGRGKSRRRNPYWSWKRRGSGLLAVLLTLSLVFGDISGLSRVVLAGQGTVREEFRIHQEEILKAAEEAIQKGEPLSEPLAVTSEKEKTEEKYQKILPADGTVYEIFPEIEQVKDVDSLELRVFIRLAEGADPASYTLTGDETLVFLYVNGGETAAEGRVNIDGYVSEFTKVEALDAEEEDMQPAGSGGAENGAVSGNGGETIAPEDSASDLIQETEKETEEETETVVPETQTKPEDTLPVEPEESAETEETVETAESTETTESTEPQESESGERETAVDVVEKETGSASATEAEEDEETAAAENTDEAVTEAAGEEAEEEKAEAAGSEAAEDSLTGDTSVDDTAADDTSGDTASGKIDSEEKSKESTITLSLRQIQRVAASLASDSEA